MSGHATATVFTRYNIIGSAGLKAAGAALAAYHEKQNGGKVPQPSGRKVARRRTGAA